MSDPNPVIEAIRSRRSIRKMRLDLSPTREQVTEIIEAATWAPNHHLTEPWRFIVIAGEERRRLGEALAEAMVLVFPDTPKEKLELERAKPLSAPVILTVVSAVRVGPKILEQEELIAAGAALQNVLLAAQALGLSTMVRTGAHSYSERMRRFLELREDESLVGMVYLGYGSEPQPIGKRTDPQEKTVWRGM
ncbi:MAG: nitroreductase [Thaumarchaeota archaeon]|nr:nitroreductase [Nitrososphaerota archaeon]